MKPLYNTNSILGDFSISPEINEPIRMVLGVIPENHPKLTNH